MVAWSSLPVQRGRHQGIIIAIGLLQFATKPGRNPLDLAHTKLLIGPHCDPSPVCASGGIPFWDHGQNPIAGFEPHHLFLAHQIPVGEAMFIDIRAPVLASSLRGDQKCAMMTRLDSRHLAHTQRIQRMRLFDTKPGPVPPRAPARPGANRQP